MIARILRERILSVAYFMREIPPVDRSTIRLEHTLFGWVLWMGRHQIDCRSEGEARYLAAFGHMGYIEVPVPKDIEVVNAVAFDVEKAVADIRRQIEEKTSWELNRKRREELTELVWEGLRDRIDKSASMPSALVS